MPNYAEIIKNKQKEIIAFNKAWNI